jgi:hypothetical protein
VSLTLGDPFLYMEKDGRRHLMVTDFEWPRIKDAGVDAELISPFSLGLDELMRTGKKYWEVALEIALRAVQQVGIQQAVVPHTFPLQLADHLRANGIELTPDREAVRPRTPPDQEPRRSKGFAAPSAPPGGDGRRARPPASRRAGEWVADARRRAH